MTQPASGAAVLHPGSPSGLEGQPRHGLAPGAVAVRLGGVSGVRPFRRVAQAGETLFDRVLCIVGALAFSQAPEFMQQYLQRLGGHLDHARSVLKQFESVATQSGLTLDKLVANSRASTDAIMVRLGDVMASSVTQVQELASAEAALRNASPFTRPFVFLRHLDHDIAGSTWAIFKPAMPTTVEGALYAAAGMVIFLSFYHGCVRVPATRVWRRYQERRALRQEPIAWRG